MTLPAIPGSPAVGDPATAAWADLVAAWITLIQNGPLGVVDTAYGPAAVHDYTATTTDIISRSVPVTNGRWYMVTAYAGGAQQTSTGTVNCRLKIAGTEVGRAIGGAGLIANQVGVGDIEWPYQATSTGSVTFALTGESSAGAFRIQANACHLTVVDIGIP